MQSADSGKGYPLRGNMMSRIRNIPLGSDTGLQMRDKIANGSSSGGPVGSLADKLLGTSLGTSPSPTVYALAEEADDLTELKEEDIWDTDVRGRGEVVEAKLDAHHPAAVAIPSYVYKDKNLDAGDAVRFFGNGHHGFKDHGGSGGSIGKSHTRRWTAADKDASNSVSSLSSLSLAFGGDGGSRGRLNVPSEGFISSSRGIPAQAAAAAAASSEDAVGAGYGFDSGYPSGAGAGIPIVGGLSFALGGAGRQQAIRQAAPVKSAPVNVPDWSKIYRHERRKPVEHYSSDEEEVDGRPVHRLPPHEIVAREAARSQKTPFSVCEGVGRTLKGADQTRYRNDILRKTGFLDGAN